MRRFGLIGYPLSHSFSKRYFDRKFEEQGLTDCFFDNFELPSIDSLPALIKANPLLEGLAVTIPHKKSVLTFLDNAEAIPASLSACNCIRINKGILTGYNTDHVGFEQSLLPLLKAHHKKALVLGNGGATASVIYVLEKLGIGYQIVSRHLHHNSSVTYSALSEKMMQAHTLIINTTPLGMYPDINAKPPIPYSFLTEDHLLYDLTYNPAITAFLQQGLDKGATIKNGEEMLKIQAEENWKIWTTDV